MEKYDVIVIGGGGFGSSAAYNVARRGKKVLVLEQFEQGHRQGSSFGETRIIRKAYFEHPGYVPLLQQGYKMWQKLEETTSHELIALTGLLLAGPPESESLTGTRQSAEEHGLELEEVDAEEFAERFPGFALPESFEMVYELDGGLLYVDDCVATYQALAAARGVEFHWSEAATHWESNGETAKVWTNGTTYEADSLIVTAGAWAAGILSSIPEIPPLKVLRKVMFWFPVKSDAYDLSLGSSCFFFEMPYGQFYGFPSLDGRVIKVCEHTGGAEFADPSQMNLELQDADLSPVVRFVKEVLTEVDPQPETYSLCKYTLSPDHQFLVDLHPQYRNVCFGAGFSGHGFKFVSVLGKALSDLAIDYETDVPIQFLGLERFRSNNN